METEKAGDYSPAFVLCLIDVLSRVVYSCGIAINRYHHTEKIMSTYDTQAAIHPVSEDDIGRTVLVSENGERWETAELARILINRESDGPREIYERIGYVCWDDYVDPENGRTEPMGRVKTWPMAKRIVCDIMSTAETAYELCFRRVNELASALKKERSYLTELERVLIEDWEVSGCDKMEVQVNGRRSTLKIEYKTKAYVLVENRDKLMAKMKRLGVDGVVGESIDDGRLQEYLLSSAVQNPDGTHQFPDVPQDVLDLVKVYEWPTINRRSLGAKVPD